MVIGTKYKIKMSRKLLKKQLREIFKEIDEIQTYVDPETGKITGYQGIPTNYGSVCFHPFFNEEKLSRYCKDYITEEEQEEVEEKMKTDELFDIVHYLTGKGLLFGEGEVKFPIVCDHPDVISGVHVQISLSMLGFWIEYTSNLDETLKKVEQQLEKLKCLKDLKNRYRKLGFLDFELSWEFMEFADEEFEEYGYSVVLILEFDGEETLEDVEKKIDDKITPLKKYLEELARYDEVFLR